MRISTESGTSGRPTLADLVDLEPGDFLRNHFGREPLFVRNRTEREPLDLTWSDVNDTLNAVAPYPRVRLLQKGKHVDPERYTFVEHEQRFVDAALCHTFMARGATLVIQATDRLTPKVERLVRGLSEDLNADVRVDIVATLVTVPGFGTHWDHTECFNVQLAGQKHWSLHKPARPCPLGSTTSHPRRSDVLELEAPQGEPTDQVTTAPGDLLYVPRGWWHMVTPKEIPSLHLSINVDVPTVSDALLWHLERLKAHEVVRQNIPHWLSHGEWNGFAQALQQVLSVPAGEMLEEFLREREVRGGREDFSLPEADASLPEPQHMLVRLRRGGRVLHAREADEIVFRSDGRTYRFDVSLTRAVDALTGRWTPFGELAGDADRSMVHALVLALWANAVVSIRDARTFVRSGAPDSAVSAMSLPTGV